MLKEILRENGFSTVGNRSFYKDVGSLYQSLSLQKLKNKNRDGQREIEVQLGISIKKPNAPTDEKPTGFAIHIMGIVKKDYVRILDFPVRDYDDTAFYEGADNEIIEHLITTRAFPWLDKMADIDHLIWFFDFWWTKGIPGKLPNIPGLPQSLIDSVDENGFSWHSPPVYLKNLSYLYFHKGDMQKAYESMKRYAKELNIKPSDTEAFAYLSFLGNTITPKQEI